MKSWLIPTFLLAAILALSVLNCRAVDQDVVRWQSQLEEAEAAVSAKNWKQAEDLISQSYEDWSGRQTYLHITAEHEVVDGADALYRRCAALISVQASECMADLAGLRHQLWLLSETERFSIKNVL
ncbi:MULTISPECIES: DUF4363 family protein [unclassified Oscillibacter]|uniref:DUF4363 family protein n=1 Tax=unclassified Oscillibacter TaxID=2629304 RepID=UPI0025EE7F23|nr:MULTISPECIES: DUF4363 family protein [unclassified Oscillibacter]